MAYGEEKKKKRRRKMRAFKMEELSAVDYPAQEGARVTLMKRAAQKSLGEMGSPVMLSVKDGHQHVLDADLQAGTTTYDRAKGEEYGHTHSWVRLEDGSIVVGMSEGHSHEIMESQEVAKALKPDGAVSKVEDDEAPGSGEPASQPGHEGPAGSDITMTEQNTSNEPAQDGQALQEMEKRAQRAEAIVGLPAEQRAYFDSLKPEDQDGFLSKRNEERTELLKRAQESDPVVYKAEDGTEFRKSDDTRLVQMAKDRDADRAELWKQRTAAEQARFEKRATDELGHLKGDVPEKAALLKAIEGIQDEETRGKALEILKAKDAGMAKAMERVGNRGGQNEGTDFEADVETAAKRIREASPDMTPEQAYSKALDEVMRDQSSVEKFYQHTQEVTRG